MPQDPKNAGLEPAQSAGTVSPNSPNAAREAERRRRWALILLFIAPALFASNMLMARATHDLIAPIGLAFWRWTVALTILLPFTAGALISYRQAIAREWRDLLILGALGMGVCGAFVYIAAGSTTATNIGLIYAASPILIVVLGRMFFHEALRPLQGLGVGLSLLGVLAVICKGDPKVLLTLDFSAGDLWVVAAMVGWALYSVLLNYRSSALPALARFAALTAGGVLILLPFTLWEASQVGKPELDLDYRRLRHLPGIGAGPGRVSVLWLYSASAWGRADQPAHVLDPALQRRLGLSAARRTFGLVPPGRNPSDPTWDLLGQPPP